MTRTKALAVVSFGSTYDETRARDIGGIERALAAALPEYDQYRAFTSKIIRARLAARGIRIAAPEELLTALKRAGYEEVLVQPTHLLPGEEYEQKILPLAESCRADFKKISIGSPLIASPADYRPLAAALRDSLPALAQGEGVVFMGHGSPRNNNSSFGRTYTLLQQVFDELDIPALVGTVEEADRPNLESVLDGLSARRYKKVHLVPLMVVAGDHAANDMYGDEPGSWKNRIEALGIATAGHLRGLGRCAAIQSLYVQHARASLAAGGR